MSTLTTLSNYSLPELCKTGGLQVIYDQSFAVVRTEIVDLTTPAGRKRQRSLAAGVSRSKTLFVKACRGHISVKEDEISDAKKEIKIFESSMDQLRDDTKKLVIEIEAYNAAEEEAYAEDTQRQEEAEKAAQNKAYEAQALLFSHLEAIIQNMEFDALEFPEDVARMHCENKGQVFDFVKFGEVHKYSTLDDAFDAIDRDKIRVKANQKIHEDFGPVFEGLAATDEPHFKMPLVDAIDYQELAAIEALVQYAGITTAQSKKAIYAIRFDSIPGVTYE